MNKEEKFYIETSIKQIEKEIIETLAFLSERETLLKILKKYLEMDKQ